MNILTREVKLVALGALATFAIKATIRAEVLLEKSVLRQEFNYNLYTLYKDLNENTSFTSTQKETIEEAFKKAVWRNK